MKDNLIKTVFLLFINALILNVADMRGKSHINYQDVRLFFSFHLMSNLCWNTKAKEKYE